jgi:hypothetical protein
MTTMFNLDLDLDLITQDELDKAIPCDYLYEVHYDHGPAKWIVWCGVCPTCGASPGQRLMCDYCKVDRLEHETAVHCNCGHVWAPARHAYVRCEPINKR